MDILSALTGAPQAPRTARCGAVAIANGFIFDGAADVPGFSASMFCRTPDEVADAARAWAVGVLAAANKPQIVDTTDTTAA